MKQIYISPQAGASLKNYLFKLGYRLISVDFPGYVSPEISCHPDIFYTKLGTDSGDPVYTGNRDELGPEYPHDVKFNAAAAGPNLICCRKYISPGLEEAFRLFRPDCRIINVPQGYTKCNIAIVDNNHFITEDEGIYKVLSGFSDIHCLKIRPGFVGLKGYSRGFIGGCSGLAGGKLFFNGNLRAHPDFKEIYEFIAGCGVEPVWFEDYSLYDIGSIIEEIIPEVQN